MGLVGSVAWIIPNCSTYFVTRRPIQTGMRPNTGRMASDESATPISIQAKAGPVRLTTSGSIRGR